MLITFFCLFGWFCFVFCLFYIFFVEISKKYTKHTVAERDGRVTKLTKYYNIKKEEIKKKVNQKTEKKTAELLIF